MFQLIKHTIGLRTTAEEEIIGMDISEHGLASAYADFLPAAPSYAGESEGSVDLSDVKTCCTYTWRKSRRQIYESIYYLS